MGDRWGPKSGGGVRPPARTEPGSASLEKYGRGEKNSATGLYEFYDIPEEHKPGNPVSWVTILEQWRLLEFDFHHILHVPDISAILPDVSWVWFESRVSGLLSTPGLLSRFFTADDEEPSDGE